MVMFCSRIRGQRCQSFYSRALFDRLTIPVLVVRVNDLCSVTPIPCHLLHTDEI